ncbi:MAG: hypothetical protein JRI68_04895 [Deltaproteobacteria bacterium]|nr:hypothetical protein [Deltaproteobacteria bacterium]
MDRRRAQPHQKLAYTLRNVIRHRLRERLLAGACFEDLAAIVWDGQGVDVQTMVADLGAHDPADAPIGLVVDKLQASELFASVATEEEPDGLTEEGHLLTVAIVDSTARPVWFDCTRELETVEELCAFGVNVGQTGIA